MAEPLRPGFRLRPNEHRLVLLISDLIASTSAAFLALYVWRQALLATQVAKGIDIARAERILRIQGIHVRFVA